MWLTRVRRWALTNPHISLHIPSESRLALSTQRKKNGMPRRPKPSLKSVVSNLHLLTAVPSFRRWPLALHFFAEEAFTSWKDFLKSGPATSGPKHLRILKDFGAPTKSADESALEAWGIHALPLDYTAIKGYVEKAHNIVSFEQEGKCICCDDELEPGKGLYPMCPNDGCEAMGHLDCWSRHALSANKEGHVIPDSCKCPSCGGEVRWGDMMKELSLRVRGQADVEKLLKTKKRRTKQVV